MARPHCDTPLVFFGASSIRQRQIADAIGTKTNGLKQKEMGYMKGWQMRWLQFIGPFTFTTNSCSNFLQLCCCQLPNQMTQVP
jgi:hypothetical protein